MATTSTSSTSLPAEPPHAEFTAALLRVPGAVLLSEFHANPRQYLLSDVDPQLIEYDAPTVAEFVLQAQRAGIHGGGGGGGSSKSSVGNAPISKPKASAKRKANSVEYQARKQARFGGGPQLSNKPPRAPPVVSPPIMGPPAMGPPISFTSSSMPMPMGPPISLTGNGPIPTWVPAGGNMQPQRGYPPPTLTPVPQSWGAAQVLPHPRVHTQGQPLASGMQQPYPTSLQRRPGPEPKHTYLPSQAPNSAGPAPYRPQVVKRIERNGEGSSLTKG